MRLVTFLITQAGIPLPTAGSEVPDYAPWPGAEVHFERIQGDHAPGVVRDRSSVTAKADAEGRGQVALLPGRYSITLPSGDVYRRTLEDSPDPIDLADWLALGVEPNQPTYDTLVAFIENNPNLKGPQGPQGPQGEQGPPGPDFDPALAHTFLAPQTFGVEAQFDDAAEFRDGSTVVGTIQGQTGGLRVAAESGQNLLVQGDEIESGSPAGGDAEWTHHGGLSVTGNISGKLEDAGGAVLNVRAFGVVGDGIADDLSALQAVNDLAETSGVPFFIPAGQYNIGTGTLRISAECIVTNETELLYSGSGVAIQVGPSSGSILGSKTIATPKVTFTGKPSTGWVEDTVGVQILNCRDCKFQIHQIHGFEVGLWMAAESGGCAYNNVEILRLSNNKINLLLEPLDEGGWVNENNFFGGRFYHASAEGTAVSGARQLKIAHADSSINNNRFYGPSLEGAVAEYVIECWGEYNYWFAPRFEGGYKVWWRSADATHRAQGNAIIYGRGTIQLEQTSDSLSRRNSVFSANHVLLEGGGDAVLALQNRSSSNNAAWAVMPTIAQSIHDFDWGTDWVCRATGSRLEVKQQGDAYPRLAIDYATGGIYMGPGTSAPVGRLEYTGDDVSGGFRLFQRDLVVGNGAFDGGSLLRLGAYRLWVDDEGRLRIKSGIPSSATDGEIVGLQE